MSAIERTNISYQKVQSPQVDVNFINLYKDGSLSFSDGDEIQEVNDKNETFIAKSKVSYGKIESPNLDTQDIFISNGGALVFKDGIDGTIIESHTAETGYAYGEFMPITFSNGMIYDIGELSNETDMSDITFTGGGRFIQTCEVWFTTPATLPTTYKWPKNTYWIDSPTGAAPTLIASKNYRIVFRQEPTKIIASVAYLY